MALPKIADARKLKDEEIAEEILAAKRKLFELRLLKATRRLEKPHEFKHNRHRLAQLLTIERERGITPPPTVKPAIRRNRWQKKPSKLAPPVDTASTQEEE